MSPMSPEACDYLIEELPLSRSSSCELARLGPTADVVNKVELQDLLRIIKHIRHFVDGE